MKIRKLVAVLSMAILFISCSGSSRTEDAKLEIKTAHEKRRTATLDGDWKTVAEMMYDNLTFTHANAVVESKAQFIDALKTKRLKYQKLEDEQTQIRVVGTAGVVSGICHILVDASGNTIDLRVEFTELWVKEGNNWKMLLWHATEIM